MSLVAHPSDRPMSGDRAPVRGGQARPGPVPMKLFGAWEVDKTPANCIPRLCTVTITRLQLSRSLPPDVTGLVIAVKMQSLKRTLRCNEIIVPASSLTGSDQPQNERLEMNLDLTFALQYPHFLKKNVNQLQILLQRRKRYKNRAMLGFKTLAGGVINMAEVLQRSHLMDKELELRENCKDMRKAEVFARITMSSLKSQPVDQEVGNGRIKAPLNDSADVESDEDVDDFSGSDGSDSENVDEAAGNVQSASRSKWRSGHNRSRQKKSSRRAASLENPNVHQRNLKQKFIALLKKFKIPDSETSDFEAEAALENELMANSSVGNIDDMFEFEDSDVDSGPEFDGDSVTSIPRPGLKPFFSSKSTLVEEVSVFGMRNEKFLITFSSQNEEAAKRFGSGHSSEDRDFPVTSSPKPSLRPFFSSKSTINSREAEVSKK